MTRHPGPVFSVEELVVRNSLHEKSSRRSQKLVGKRCSLGVDVSTLELGL